MKFFLSRTFLLSIILPAVLVVSGVLLMPYFGLPKLIRLRHRIDNNRTTILVLEKEQSNLDVIRQTENSVKTDQKRLDDHIWKFATEEFFFTFWDQLAQEHELKLDGPDVAEASPTGDFVLRPATITISGTRDNLLQAMNFIQEHQPLLAITKVVMTGTGTLTQATLSINSVWK